MFVESERVNTITANQGDLIEESSHWLPWGLYILHFPSMTTLQSFEPVYAKEEFSSKIFRGFRTLEEIIICNIIWRQATVMDYITKTLIFLLEGERFFCPF